MQLGTVWLGAVGLAARLGLMVSTAGLLLAPPALADDSGGLTMTSAAMTSTFSAGMVLQQGNATNVFGTGSSNASFLVELLDSSGGVQSQAAGQSDGNGLWSVAMPIPVGGPYTLSVVGAGGASLVTIRRVFGGEVWLCSGQSNMERQLSLTDVQPEQSPDAQLSLFYVNGAVSTTVRQDTPYRWSWFNNANAPVALDNPPAPAATMPSLPNFSAICYEFGKSLRAQLGVPIGLIQSAHGSTALEEWLPSGRIPQIPRPKGGQPLVYADAYNAMLAWLIPYTLRGVVWYQGDGNVQGPLPYKPGAPVYDYGAFRYLSLLPILISDWRQLWGENFAFIDVQLEGDGCAANNLLYPSPYSAELRESQRMVMSAAYGAAFVPTYDWGFLVTNNVHSNKTTYQGRSILNFGSMTGAKGCASSQPNAVSPVPIAEAYAHPPFKTVVGDRIAAQAMALAYGGPPTSQSPDLVVANLSATGAVLTPHNLGTDTLGLLAGTGNAVQGFALCCDAYGAYMPASGTINPDQSVSVAPNDGYALAGSAQNVRYGWTGYIASPADIAQNVVAPWSLPIANLVTSAGLPMLGFSSDPYWKSATIGRSPTPDPTRLAATYYQVMGAVTQIVPNPDGSRDVLGWACAKHHWDSLYVTLAAGSTTIGPQLASIDPNDPSIPGTCATTGSPVLNGFDFYVSPAAAAAASGATINVTARSPQGFGDVLLNGSGQTLP